MMRWLALVGLLFSASLQAVVFPNGTTRVLGVVLWFSDTQTFGTTITGLDGALFSRTDSMAKFWSENSYGRMQIVGKVHPTVLRSAYPLSSGKCGGVLTTEVRALLTAQGVDLSQYDYLTVVHPRVSTCAWDAIVGGGGMYLNGFSIPKTMAHEFGHGAGLGHARSVTPQTTLGLAGTSAWLEYGNRTDVMGNSYYAHSNAMHKAQLGYLDGRVYEHRTGKATYTIAPLESPTGMVAIKVQAEADTSPSPTQLWIEYRQPIGFDGAAWSPASAEGVMLYASALLNFNGKLVSGATCQPCIVHTHNGAGGFYNSGIKVGETYNEQKMKVKVTVNSISAQEMSVTVDFGDSTTQPPATFESSNGTTVPPAAQIVDSTGAIWTYADGVIFRNGAGTPTGSCRWTQIAYLDRVVTGQQESCAKTWTSNSWR